MDKNKFNIPIWIWGKTRINTGNGFIYHEYMDSHFYYQRYINIKFINLKCGISLIRTIK